MWVIGIGFCLIGSGVNTLYTFRLPSVTLSQSAIQFLAYPLGKAWEFILPDWGLTVYGIRHSLNPGPFNYKACTCRLETRQDANLTNLRDPGKHSHLHPGQLELPYPSKCRCIDRAASILWRQHWLGLRNHHHARHHPLWLFPSWLWSISCCRADNSGMAWCIS